MSAVESVRARLAIAKKAIAASCEATHMAVSKLHAGEGQAKQAASRSKLAHETA